MSYTGWAIVEIKGHRRHVGFISEVTEYGVTMCRIQVPHFDLAKEGWLSEHYYGGSAIFGIQPCTQEHARAENKTWEERYPTAPALEPHRPDGPYSAAELAEAGEDRPRLGQRVVVDIDGVELRRGQVQDIDEDGDFLVQYGDGSEAWFDRNDWGVTVKPEQKDTESPGRTPNEPNAEAPAGAEDIPW